jgi:hypothetical protein
VLGDVTGPIHAAGVSASKASPETILRGRPIVAGTARRRPPSTAGLASRPTRAGWTSLDPKGRSSLVSLSPTTSCCSQQLVVSRGELDSHPGQASRGAHQHVAARYIGGAPRPGDGRHRYFISVHASTRKTSASRRRPPPPFSGSSSRPAASGARPSSPPPRRLPRCALSSDVPGRPPTATETATGGPRPGVRPSWAAVVLGVG